MRCAFPPHETVAEICRDLFEPSLSWVTDFESERGLAYSILGYRNYHLAHPEDNRIVPTTRPWRTVWRTI